MSQVAAEYDVPDPPQAPGSAESAATQTLTAGAQLARAREAAGLSRAEVAGKLKFSVRQIDIVESDNYAALGGPTFVRGLVRTYAKLLGTEVGPILAALDGCELPPETGQVVADRKGIPFPAAAGEVSPIFRYVVISLGVIAAGILVLYLWHGDELLSGPTVNVSPVKQAATVPSPSPGSSTAIDVRPTVIDTPSPITPTALQPTAPSPAERAPVAPAAGEPAAEKAAGRLAERQPSMPAVAAGGVARRIQLSFERDSWVNVKDASGRIVLSQLNAAGTQQTIEGRSPFELVIGNAAFVKLRYRDAAVDLKPYTRAEVARLTLE